MKKGFKMYLIAWAILLVLFNIIAFVSPGWTGIEKYSPSFWIGYVFITLCFIGNLVCAHYAFKAESARKLFYNIPLITISYAALIVSFIVGGLCMFLSSLPYWVGVIVCSVFFALYAIAIVKASASAEFIGQVDDKLKLQTSFIRDMTAKAEELMARAQSPELKDACKKVYEAVRYSDPMSNEALSVIEAKITLKVEELSSAICENNSEKAKKIADEIVDLISDRSKKCKALK